MWPCGPPPPPPTLYSLKVRALIAGQEARDGGIQWSSQTIPPKNLRVGLTQHPLAPALEKCSVKPWRGGMAKANTGHKEGLMNLGCTEP